MPSIAILEDRQSYARDLAIILQNDIHDATIERFSTVDDAIAQVREGKKWDIWIVDLMMPPGKEISPEDAEHGLATGTVFIKRLFEFDALPAKKIVVVTSRNTDADNFSEMGDVIVEFQKSGKTQVEIAQEVVNFLK